jgi:hypothetical protein
MQTQTAYEARRIRVDELLRQCTHKKVLLGGTEEARKLAEEAYELANDDPVLDAPWPQLAAYRLAHLILRGAPSGEMLEQADRLLARASGVGDDVAHLGPMPRLYRLAVLHRLSRSNDASEPLVTSERLESAFVRARDAVNSWLRTHGANPEGEDDQQRRAPIQDGLFNMLELAAYFLGAKYESIEGLGGPYTDLKLGPDSWMLVGPDPQISTVRLPRELALAELKDRGQLQSGTVLFQLYRDQVRNRAEWKLAEQEDWKSTNFKQIYLLALLLQQSQEWTTEELRHCVTGEHGEAPDDRFRQVKSRLNKNFRALAGVEIVLVPEPRSHPIRVNPDALVFGAVEVDLLRGNSTRRRR